MTVPADVLTFGLLLTVLLALSIGFLIGSCFEGCRRGGTLDLIDRVCDLEGRLERATHRYPRTGAQLVDVDTAQPVRRTVRREVHR